MDNWTLAHKICLQSLPLGKDYDAAERRGRPVEGDAAGGIEEGGDFATLFPF